MITLAIVAVLLIAIYKFGTRNFDYWSKRGVKHGRPVPFFGTDARRYLLRSSITQMATETYLEYPDERFVGYFRSNRPELVVRDPELIKRILVTDFASFTRRGLAPRHGVVEPLLRNLFFVDGDLWRLLRQRLSPAFSSGKLRAMFPLVADRAARLQRSLARSAGARDARDLMARYTVDFIGSVGFGLDPGSLDDDDSAFRRLGAKIVTVTPTRALTTVCKSLFPDAFRRAKFLGQELEDEVVGLVNGIQKQRNYKPCGRNDFIDLLLELKEKGRIEVESLERAGADGRPARAALQLDDELVAAQAFIFFAAGFETSSTATSFALHQLAHHPRAQAQAQAEVDRVLLKYDNELCFDAVKEMTYLEWCLLEAMRIFPSSGYLLRQCSRPYAVPGSDVTIDEGVSVLIPLQALHMDPQHFDNPEEFRPERFSPEEVAKRHKFVYLPFGEGPRSCIGGRLGKMQSVAGLAAVLSRSRVSPAPGCPARPRAHPAGTITQTVLGGVPLVFSARAGRARQAA